MSAVPVDLRLLGVPCRVLCATPELAAEVGRLWRPFTTLPGTAPARTVQLGGPGTGDPTAGDLLVALATELNQAALTGTGLLATHAAALVLGGGTVAFSAASGTGKSTLTAALLQLGAGYLSDEALCLDRADGRLEAYPRPLALSRWSAEALGVGWPAASSPLDWSVEGPEVLVSPEDVGGTTPPVVPPLRHVVLMERPPAAAGPALVPAPQSEGMAALLSRSFNHWHDPLSSTVVVAGAVAGARVWTLRVGPPRETAELVVELLSAA